MDGSPPDIGPDFTRETALRLAGARHVAGVDEVGRGPLAGPVTAAAVVLDPECIPPGLNDSKTLSRARREALEAQILACARVAIVHVEVDEIDSLNILRASQAAMVRALAALDPVACHALVDGNLLPRDMPCAGTAVVGGDRLALSVAAASIVAKCARDRIMADLAGRFPGYGWETNMGYGSAAHRAALTARGATPHHRRSFRPVADVLARTTAPTG